jgi:hypothetical protein
VFACMHVYTREHTCSFIYIYIYICMCILLYKLVPLT